MPTESRVPKYCLHKPSGRAYLRIRGRVRYLGPHGSPESLEAYGRLVAELAALPPLSPANLAMPGLTVVELAAAYLDFAEAYYRKGGVPTQTVDDVRRAINLVPGRPAREVSRRLPGGRAAREGTGGGSGLPPRRREADGLA